MPNENHIHAPLGVLVYLFLQLVSLSDVSKMKVPESQ